MNSILGRNIFTVLFWGWIWLNIHKSDPRKVNECFLSSGARLPGIYTRRHNNWFIRAVKMTVESNEAITLALFGFTTVWDWLSSLTGILVIGLKFGFTTALKANQISIDCSHPFYLLYFDWRNEKKKYRTPLKKVYVVSVSAFMFFILCVKPIR